MHEYEMDPSISRYSEPISAAKPGAIFILVDQSLSMKEPYGDGTRATAASVAVNRVIYEIQQASQAGEKIKDRCFVGAIGYGEDVTPLVGAMTSQLPRFIRKRETVTTRVPDGRGAMREQPWEMPVWVEPRAFNGTPMAKAIQTVHPLVAAHIKAHPRSFPPVVINITDGMPDDLQNEGDGQATRAEAQRLTQLHTTNGNVLLFNAHIGPSGEAEILLPSDLSSQSNKYARFLFELSSAIPEPLFAAAEGAGFKPQLGARGFVFNARPESLVKLLTFGSMPMMRH